MPNISALQGLQYRASMLKSPAKHRRGERHCLRCVRPCVVGLLSFPTNEHTYAVRYHCASNVTPEPQAHRPTARVDQHTRRSDRRLHECCKIWCTLSSSAFYACACVRAACKVCWIGANEYWLLIRRTARIAMLIADTRKCSYTVVSLTVDIS